MTASALVWADDLDAPIAWRDGRPVSRRHYLADVAALAARLPNDGPMLNLTGDRYRFAVGLGAAMLRGQTNLMPPNHTPDTIARLRSAFATAYGLADEPAAAPADSHVAAGAAGVALPLTHHDIGTLTPAEVAAHTTVPAIDDATLTAQVLTSGSTGAPLPHPKHWGLLVRNTQAGARRLADAMGRRSLAGVTLVATVPPQHMYGFESTVLIAMLGGAAFDTERPFYPADIAAALARAPRPRMLVTTPFHLKALLDSGVALPAIDLALCATAPLAPQLAARAEAALAAPLLEIYGCTEAGQVATRRTTVGAEWHAFDGLRLTGDGAESVVQGGHVPQPTPLADVLEVVDAQTFRLLGRSNDLINIAGKRSSLGHLNYHLNATPNVQDGAFWMPADAAAGGVVRLVAFVVAPDLPAHELHTRITTALRERIDAAFLPRRVVAVAALPREPGTGKLPAGAFAAWAEQVLASPSRHPPTRPGPAAHPARRG